MTMTERIGDYLLGRTSRRSFLTKATLTATALTVAPVDFLLRPGSAYAYICRCGGGQACDCSQLCCDGYTQFCCTINNGINACPPGTFAGGWWKADGSMYCSGPRYYIDCMGECQGCGCGGGNFCPSCDNLTCECALGSCGNRQVGCTEFRYGQCHQEIACSGRIACRMVSCTPPWVFDPTCTTVAQTDDTTANHYAPCQNGPTSNNDAVGMAATLLGDGYWIVYADGGIRTFGSATDYGSMKGQHLNQSVVGMASDPKGDGYWMVAADGGLFSFGGATFYGSMGSQHLNQPVTGMAADHATAGYYFAAADGGVFTFDTPYEGSMGGQHLNQPVVGMAVTPTGGGYWLVAADGGIFTFGDAGFFGSMGGQHLNAPIVGMASSPSGRGYWLVAADGGIFTFGDARFFGSAA